MTFDLITTPIPPPDRIFRPPNKSRLPNWPKTARASQHSAASISGRRSIGNFVRPPIFSARERRRLPGPAGICILFPRSSAISSPEHSGRGRAPRKSNRRAAELAPGKRYCPRTGFSRSPPPAPWLQRASLSAIDVGRSPRVRREISRAGPGKLDAARRPPGN